MTVEKTEERVCITTRRFASQNHPGEITLSGLTPAEFAKVSDMEVGGQWIACENGRLVSHPRRASLPEVTEDSDLLPFWQPLSAVTPKVSMQEEMFLPAQEEWSRGNASITIQHLCGYNYTPKRYAEASKVLESFGFLHLRSKREEDGKFWELWFLPNLFFAKGRLADAIASRSEKLDAAIEFLRKNVPYGFGTLDASFQRLAMSIPD